MREIQGRTVAKKKGAMLLILLLLLLGLSACGKPIAQEGETKEVTDCMGRAVTIPQDPQRVVCLYASTAHIVAMLDEGDRIVGVPNGVKTDVLMSTKYPKLEEASVPAQTGVINAEELLSLDADVALVRESTAQTPGETEKLDKLGIPYVVVDYASIEGLKEAVTVTGQVFNKETQAAEYNRFVEETITMVEGRLSGKTANAPKVYHAVNEAIRTDAQDDISMEIIQKAGCIDVAEGKALIQEKDSAYTTIEEIYNWSPEAIIANEASVKNYILNDGKWSGLTAVKEQQVYTLPVGISRWCHPGSMEPQMGVLAVAYQFYPEAFADFDFNAYVRDYYQKYFDLSLDKETVNKILSGEGMRKSNSADKGK
ncbi:MAG: ABC transporter substrate-binding protein [Anaerovoracaceae bacterium]